MKKSILIIAILLGVFSSVVPMMPLVNAYTTNVYFHFQGIGAFGNSVIVTVTGSHGEYQLWRLWLAPFIGNEFTRFLDTSYGFTNGESATACLTDVGNGIPGVPSCYSTTLNFNSGTDFYLTVPR